MAEGDRTIRLLTASSHRRLDSVVGGLDLANAAEYGKFLAIMAAGFAAAEQWLAEHAVHRPSDAAALCRAELARQDIANLRQFTSDMIDFGEGARAAVAGGLVIAGDPNSALGVLYTLEGSRLGARHMRARVPAAFPQAFLCDERAMIPWAELRAMLRGLESEAITVAAVASMAVFAKFQSVANAVLAETHSNG